MPAKLTAPEIQARHERILKFHNNGLLQPEIADQMGLSPKTLRRHYREIGIRANRGDRSRLLLTVEHVRATARVYTELSAFRQEWPSMYSAAWRWGLLEDLTSHMSRKGIKSPRYVYSIQLEDEVYYGLSADPVFRFNQHRTEGTKSVRDLIRRGAVLTVLSKALPHNAAGSLERLLIKEARASGKLVLNSTGGGELGGYILVWSPEAITQEALKYRTRTQFYKGSGGAYFAARKASILDEVCRHMGEPKGRKKPTTGPIQTNDWQIPAGAFGEAAGRC